MKNQKEIEDMIESLEYELANLPVMNTLGEPNDEDIEETTRWIEDLKSGEPYEEEEVSLWIEGSVNSLLCDYE